MPYIKIESTECAKECTFFEGYDDEGNLICNRPVRLPDCNGNSIYKYEKENDNERD